MPKTMLKITHTHSERKAMANSQIYRQLRELSAPKCKAPQMFSLDLLLCESLYSIYIYKIYVIYIAPLECASVCL